MTKKVTDELIDDCVALGLTTYTSEDFNFLNSVIELNDYQLQTLFMKGRQMGHTYMVFMKLLLDSKRYETIVIEPKTFEQYGEYIQTETMRKNTMKEFENFVKSKFNEDFEIQKYSSDYWYLNYTGERFKRDYPELHV